MKKAIIIGAGPAGLTAAYQLLKETDIHPIIIEESEFIGGISRTAEYKGNRMDLGGHRFFSKNEQVNAPAGCSGKGRPDAWQRKTARRRRS